MKFTATMTSEPLERVTVIKGLQGQDGHIDLLESYFKEMQKATVETATPDDFLSFAACAHYFGVIMFETTDPNASQGTGDKDADGEPEEATLPASELAYLASSRPTSPPASSVASSSAFNSPGQRQASDGPENLYTEDEQEIYASFAMLSEKDKVLKWREAFMAKVEEADEEPMIPFNMQHNGLGEAMISYVDKGKSPEIPTFLVPHTPDKLPLDPHSHSHMKENPDNYINWPDDMVADEDSANTDAELPSSPESSGNMHIYRVIDPVAVDKEFGREYLEPEQYAGPIEEPETPVDPKLQKLIYDSAVKFRDQLRARTVADYERKKAARHASAYQSRLPILSPPSQRQELKPIGIIYLTASQHFDDPLHIGEFNMGFYIVPDLRKKELYVNALNDVVRQAFSDTQCHRLQSILVENNDKLFMLELLTAAGFRHEGVRRRAFYSSIAHEWKDITYFAMLATEWVYDNNNNSSSARLRTTSPWDEILARHQRERDDLQRLEEKTIKRSTSTETIRQRLGTTINVDMNLTDLETQSTDSDVSSSSSVRSHRRLESGNVGPIRTQRREPVTRFRNHSPGPSITRKRSLGGSSIISASSTTSNSSNWVMLGSDDI